MRTSNIELPTSNFEVKKTFSGIHFDVRRWTFDVRRSYFFLLSAGALALASLAAAPATQPTSNPTIGATTKATTHPTTKAVIAPTAPHLQLRECTVFVLDASTGLLNPEGIVTATLPAMIPDKRYGSASTPAATEQPNNNNNGWIVFNGRAMRRGFRYNNNESDIKASDSQNLDIEDPSPVGIIRLTGSVDSKVDVSITAKGGTFAASWPKAEDRPNQLLWRDLVISDQPGVALATLSDDHWLSKQRADHSAYLSLKHVPSEKFLLYDLQMPFPSPLKIKAGKDDSVELTNGGKYPLHEVMLYRDGKEAVGGDLAIADVTHAKSATSKSAVAPTTSPASATPAPTTLPVVKAAATTAPSAKSSTNSSTTVHLAAAATTQPISSTRWSARMDAAGLENADREMIDRLLARYAVDKRMTAVYAMDSDELEHLLPMEVVPQPAKISRFALVIVINADPAAGNIVDDLIKQLSDEDWTKRDAAYHALASMGPAATTKLQAASKSPDLETAWRAERLLALNPQQPKP